MSVGGAAGACADKTTAASPPDATVEAATDDTDADPGTEGGPGFNLEAGVADALSWCDAGPPSFYLETNCEDFLVSPCGLPKGVTPGQAGDFTTVQCYLLCARPERKGRINTCILSDGSLDPLNDAAVDAAAYDPLDGAPDGTLLYRCDWCASGGRRPDGFRARSARRSATATGALLSQLAELEAASVGAFHALSAELAQHGAPPSLILAADRAAREEERHARVTRRLARKYGAEAPRPRSAAQARGKRGRRSLEELARENAVEGCVRETFGAFAAAWQGLHAADPEIAREMRVIAGDETGHAALAWAIDEWARTRLSAPARERIARHRAAAQAALRRELASPLPASAASATGMPSGAEAVALYDELARTLWAS